MKNSSWLNIWATVAFIGGFAEAVFAGTFFGFVACSVLTAGSGICKTIEKQKG